MYFLNCNFFGKNNKLVLFVVIFFHIFE